MTRLLYALVVLALVLLVILFKANGATEHPLLVDAAIRESTAPAPPPWRLYSHCPVDRRNVPVIQEREA